MKTPIIVKPPLQDMLGLTRVRLWGLSRQGLNVPDEFPIFRGSGPLTRNITKKQGPRSSGRVARLSPKKPKVPAVATGKKPWS